MEIELPANGWKPRNYQMAAWSYMENGGKNCDLVWHRRAGKDEVLLHRAACSAHERIANYWHMLPQHNQVRKAIWDAVNPHTGKRRIDEAFPIELREATRENEMLIKFKVGSTWQALGSDNFQGAIGSTPAGICASEWAQSNPAAKAYLRPILLENGGWWASITTPRGKNHAYRTLNSSIKNPNSFGQILTVNDTGIFTEEQLADEKQAYIDEYGLDMGTSLYEQEYLCSFDAAILGAYYGEEFRRIKAQGRICKVPHDPDYPVHTAWDIGRKDSTVIWWYQVIANEIRILDCYANSFKDPDHYAEQVLGREVKIDIIDKQVKVTYGDIIPEIKHRQAYNYSLLHLPHDARQKTLAAQGKSVMEQFAAVFGWQHIKIVPNLSIQDGIQATRKMLNKAYFSEHLEETDALEAVMQYKHEWDDTLRKYRDTPLHDWCSDYADALRMMAIAWQDEYKPKEVVNEAPRGPQELTIDQMIANNRRKRLANER